MQKLEDHLINVSKYSVLIGKEIELNKKNLFNLVAASRFHDIGKLKINKNIIFKNKSLNTLEFEIIKKHPIYSVELIKNKKFNNDIMSAILCHHEHYDGTGYNYNLKGEDIPILARIISIADTYDAITNSRAYSNKRTHEYAVKEIEYNSGTQFDPELVYAFKNSIKYINTIWNIS